MRDTACMDASGVPPESARISVKCGPAADANGHSRSGHRAASVRSDANGHPSSSAALQRTTGPQARCSPLAPSRMPSPSHAPHSPTRIVCPALNARMRWLLASLPTSLITASVSPGLMCVMCTSTLPGSCGQAASRTRSSTCRPAAVAMFTKASRPNRLILPRTRSDTRG